MGDMMKIHRAARLSFGTFPTTSTGEVGKVRKQTRNQHPHHHPPRGCGGVVGMQARSKNEVGKARVAPARLPASPLPGSGPRPFGIISVRPIRLSTPGSRAGTTEGTMAEPFDEADDGSREVTSALRHEITKQPGPDGSKTVNETRGIRRASWQSPAAGPAPEAERTFGLMTMAANRHLRAVGEMDAHAVMETAETLSSEYPTKEKFSEHMHLWAENLKIQKGALSIDATAAQFLQTADHLLQILNKTPEMQAAAFAFADAWHWWHLELYGEHELAAKADTAERAVAGLEAGPEALKRNRALRAAIIEAEYSRYAATADGTGRGSAKRAAAAVLSAVSTAFDQQALGPIRESTLERTLRAIIKDRGQVHDR
jgi:hypothetical protein